MTTRKYLSPGGVPIVGTLERLSGLARISGISDEGEPEFSGGTEVCWDEQGTEVFWDDQITATRKGKIVYLDENGGEWTFDQLTPEPDEEDEEDGA